MRSMDQWGDEMSSLYDKVVIGEVEVKTASELSNICGKALKAEQLKLAREVFESDRPPMPSIRAAEDQKKLTQ
jgi:hypothetical protein